MTLEEFVATREWCDDLGEKIQDARWEDGPKGVGYVYLGTLYIEQVQEHWPEKAKAKGKWYLLIERDETITDDLSKLETELWEWAKDSGHFD